MNARRAALLVATLVIAPSGDAAAQSAPPSTITVRVYDNAALSDALKRDALRVADSTLAASVRIVWVHCGSASPDPACGPPVARELILRIAKAYTAIGRRTDPPLGDAYVGAGVGGVLATIYADSARQLAAEAASGLATVLGYAIAHELGHLLLASSAHGDRGLMRARWRPEELYRGRRRDWTFTEREAAAIRDRLGQLAVAELASAGVVR